MSFIVMIINGKRKEGNEKLVDVASTLKATFTIILAPNIPKEYSPQFLIQAHHLKNV